MKKLLMGTTALMGASVIASGAMAMPIQSKTEEGTPILSASIVAQFEAGIADNDDNVNSTGTRDGGFVNGRFAEVFFNGELTADNGLVYGAKIHLATGQAAWTQTGAATTSGFPGREYIYFSGGWGSLELGNWPGADTQMNLCPVCNTYASNGLIDTPFKSYRVNPSPGGPGFRDGGGNANWFTYGAKVSYFTPVVAGLQAGVSYVPENRDYTGTPATNPFSENNGASAFKDVIELGAQYNGDFGPMSLALSVVGSMSDSDLASAPTGLNINNEVTGLGVWEVGAVLRYAGFQLGATYFDDGNTGALKNRDFGFESTGWTLDAAYFLGPWAFELQYVDTHRAGASRTNTEAAANAGTATATGTTDEFDFTGIGFGVGYDVAPGLKWYGEVVHFDYDFTPGSAVPLAAGASGDNSGLALLTGVYVSF